MTETEIRSVLAAHDGTSGFARSMCPTCQVIHPCQTYRLASTALERVTVR